MFVKHWDRGVCIECLTCVMVCPNDNLSEFDHKPTRARVNSCTGCNYCTLKCPSGAIYHSVHSGEDGYGYWTRSVVDKIGMMAKTGKKQVEAKGTKRKFLNFDDLIFLPAQIHKKPLLEDEAVDSSVIIGPNSKRPVHLKTPIMIGAMSFGALSKEAKTALARATRVAGSMANSGEGGMLPEAREAADKYTLQYSTGRFGISDETLKKADAIEIKIGQGAKPGMGGHLLGPKVTAEIAAVRHIEPGSNAISPSRHLDINSPSELGERVESLRRLTGGVPIGIKIVGGDMENDLKYIADGTIKPDFLVIDGSEGGTGAAPVIAKDHIALPLVYSLSKAADILKEAGLKNKITLIAAGGLRKAEDFSKALALGADAVYTSGAVKIAMGCVYCRACHTGKCPTGICTQNKRLRDTRFDPDKATEGVVNFIKASTNELEEITRIVGKSKVSDLDRNDLFALTEITGRVTNIKTV